MIDTEQSIVLGKYFQKEYGDASSLEGKKCVELGCGCGLPGLVLGKLGTSVLIYSVTFHIIIDDKIFKY